MMSVNVDKIKIVIEKNKRIVSFYLPETLLKYNHILKILIRKGGAT